jgi:hypothetical protein
MDRHDERDDDGSSAGALRAAWRAEDAEWSRAALERWQHEQTLVDVVRECMYRGDTVAVRFAAHTFTGVVTSVGDDVVRIAAPDGAVDVRVTPRMPAVVRIVSAARRGGTRGDTTLATFRARLRQLDRTRVRLGVHPADDAVEGTMLLGRDHVCVTDRDGGRAYVPMESVSWVRAVDVD